MTSDQNRNIHYHLSPKDEQDYLPKSPDAEKESLETKENPNSICPSDKIPMIDVFNYPGTIELGYQMVKRELIDDEIFISQIGYRVENIFNENSLVQKQVSKHIRDNERYYKDLFKIKKLIKKVKQSNLDCFATLCCSRNDESKRTPKYNSKRTPKYNDKYFAKFRRKIPISFLQQ
ncbi:MAG: hypothetical protein LBL79_03030 [Prevotella sp.]|nr:hypothetical protein [Prevotella sp.]